MYNLKGKESACDHCGYKGICGFNSKQNCYSYIGKKSKEKILEELKGE